MPSLRKSYVEVDEQSLSEIHKFHICHQLSDVNLTQTLNGLQFYNYGVFYNDVHIHITDVSPFVYDIDVPLSLMFELPLFQFNAEHVFIKPFQQAGTQSAMYFNGCANYPIGQPILIFRIVNYLSTLFSVLSVPLW